MKGRRNDTSPSKLQPGEYGRWPLPHGDGGWYCCTPDGTLGNISKHTVVEHEDGTITVTPSILIQRRKDDPKPWHGFLTAGVWSGE